MGPMTRHLRMMRALQTSLVALALCGCGAATDMSEAFSKQEKVSAHIKEKYGWTTQVGWNIHNGRFTQVTVGFTADEVKGQTVASLVQASEEAIKSSFNSRPQNIFIQVRSPGEPAP